MIYIWKCCMCEKRIQTDCDFHINSRPICCECNAEMTPQEEVAMTPEEITKFVEGIQRAMLRPQDWQQP